MSRARFAVVTALVGACAAGAPGRLMAQKAPEFHTVLAGKKVEPPFKGQADVEYVQPVTKKDGENVIIGSAVSDDEAKELFPDGWDAPKPYLRYVPQPGK